MKILIFFIIILLLFTFLFEYRKIIYKNNLEKLKIFHLNIIKMLNDIKPYLEKNGLTYFIMSGTLLGYIRHNKSFIPYDDDVDLGIINEDDINIKIQNFKKDISEIGYELNEKFFGYSIEYKDKSFPGYIDLFMFYKNNDKYKLNLQGHIVFRKEYFYESELLPLKEDHFEGVLIKLPNQPIVYLKRQFGNNCLEECIYTHCHQDNRINKYIISFLNMIYPLKVNYNKHK
jgi:phosphorylcholine metabolism protein LicD